VDHIYCPQCRQQQPAVHIYCFRCGEPLPSEAMHGTPNKAARFFAGTKVSDGDPEGAYLRVSCYLREQTVTSDEGSVTIPGHHVRFSVWVGNEARCVISIPEGEALDLARFISSELGHGIAPPGDAELFDGSAE
jgi:hypothetical protein